MHQIIPAILPKNQTDLNKKVTSVIGIVSHVQVDVCDGVFVPSKTQFTELLYLDEIEYELDLMIDQPERDIVSFIEMQPARLIIHLESVHDHVRLFLALEKVRGIIEIGLAISNATDNAVLEKYIEDCDFVQFMGIHKIGFQGEPFDESVLEKIRYFHTQYPNIPISVDGAVNTETINKIAKIGVTRFIVGSAIFNNEDPQENIKKLESLLQ